MIKMAKKPKIPVCYFCKEVTDEDHYCYGCKHYVCDKCDKSSPFGDHNVEDHQDTEEEDEED